MQSVVNSGLKQKVLDSYKRAIIQTYGFQHLITMTLLEKAGLVKLQVKNFYVCLTFLKKTCNNFRQVQEVMLFVADC